MQIRELFGKTITNIYAVFGVEQGWLDTAECFIELDNFLIIDIPYGFSDTVWVKDLNPNADSILKNLEDYPVYYVNKEGKSIGEIAKDFKKRERNVFNRLRKSLFGQQIKIKEYEPYKVEYKENKAKNIPNKKIIDFLWYNDESDKGFFLLDNGYIITETKMSPSGTGLAGLNYYESLEALITEKGKDFKRLTL